MMAATVVVSCKDIRGRYQARKGGEGGVRGFLCARGNEFLKRPPRLPGPTIGRSCPHAEAAAVTLPAGGVGLALACRTGQRGGRHLLPTSTLLLSNKKDGRRKVWAAGHGGHCCCWRHPRPPPLVTTTMSAMTITISTSGRFPPHRALALRLNAWLYLTVLSTACAAPLGHAFAESGMQSTPMANYVNNSKCQEWAADDTCHVSMRECTSWRC
jgi:hypothetical protein